VPAAPARAGADRGHGHPRHDRGPAGGRPDRRPGQGAAAAAGHAPRAVDQPGRRGGGETDGRPEAAGGPDRNDRRRQPQRSPPMNEQLADLLEKLPAYLGGHMLLSVTALGVSLALSLPLGLAASRRPRLTGTTPAVAGVIQTVPSLALLALVVMLLGGMIGFVPAFLALALYSILPMLANTVEGIKGVNPALTRAARGLGMNGRQVLFRVEVPLA